MDEFARMVEVYKWRGSGPKQKHEDTFTRLDARPAAQVPHDSDEQESADSGCTRASPKRDGANSSPSPSLLQNVGRNLDLKITQIDVDSVVSQNKPLSFSLGHWNRPQKKQRLLQNRLQNHPSRQLVFSEEDMGAKGSAERRMKSKKVTKKGSNKKEKVEVKQDMIESTSHVEASILPDFYSDSECEKSAKELSSPCEQFPSELATPSEWNGGKARTRKRHPGHTLMCGKSPYFMHSKQKAKTSGANKDDDKHMDKPRVMNAEVKPYVRKRRKEVPVSKQKAKTNGANKDDDNHMDKPRVMNAEVKPYVRKRRKEVPVSKNNADDIGINYLAGHHIESSDWEDSGEKSAQSTKQPWNTSDSSSSKSASGGKKSVYFATVKALGQRDIVNKTWVPPVSVHALIQEELYQDPWKVLVACMLLNKTSGKQMRKIIWDLFALCPTPEAAVAVETSKIEEVIRGLGLQKKRACMIQKFSKDYLGKEWSNVGQLHGIGKYATDAYAIFCEGRWQEVQPEDHKLVDYWQYLCATEGLGYAFKDDREKGDDDVLQALSVQR